MGVHWSKDIDQTLAARERTIPARLVGFQCDSGVRRVCSGGRRVL
jgi:hypothetical protein